VLGQKPAVGLGDSLETSDERRRKYELRRLAAQSHGLPRRIHHDLGKELPGKFVKSRAKSRAARDAQRRRTANTS
jgi:hypothetical protein